MDYFWPSPNSGVITEQSEKPWPVSVAVPASPGFLKLRSEIAGLVIRKTEKHSEAQTQHEGSKILKICTFKVRDEYLGEKFGELLLKQALWFAQHNNYDLVYLTVYPKHTLLIRLLSYYGFVETMRTPIGELVMEKPILCGPLPALSGNALDFARTNYPRFHDGSAVGKFCVPIQSAYHRRLFPEIAFGRDLPLFPSADFGPILTRHTDRTPGNTIRKVYLCRARTTMIDPGDILLFYMSKDESLAASQSITTLAIAEQVRDIADVDELIKHAAKRSVYSADEMRWMSSQRPLTRQSYRFPVGRPCPTGRWTSKTSEPWCLWPPSVPVDNDANRRTVPSS